MTIIKSDNFSAKLNHKALLNRGQSDKLPVEKNTIYQTTILINLLSIDRPCRCISSCCNDQ